ncbi:hypothetical protein F7R01_00795 [Pseudomonas argentinensis]|uniref:Uncharacterized protein n=1 Tax=Phytopseudomonas argentinensis TaxID=289370 RepID=A0A1I3NV03_9GAMM|nr:hypothetical protein [Pseudomonas argentinensis]KAB0549793.1 hypothetical protein F7R01_00795 [Pseudomonas argentinensis]SFJ12606.1 hypothetical protein SAMN05216602_4017 [Pseudomonas argentinensis]
MIYPSVQSAVVSALAAECIDNTSKQAWQKLIDLDTVRVGSGVSASDRMQADCWVFARLHSQLIPRHWNALVAKYSTHKGRKVQAISALVPVVASHAPRLFIGNAVTAWAIPPMKGAAGKRSVDMIVLPEQFYDLNRWDPEARPERTRRRWRQGINEVLESLVTEAMVAAENILDREGVLSGNCA